jgi:hypothetical protein
MFATPEPIDRVVADPGKLGALGPIVMRCLAKTPEDRFPGMADVTAALEAAIAEPTDAPARKDRSRRPPSSPPAPAGVRPLLGPGGIALGVVAVLLLVILGARELRGGRVEAAPAATSATALAPAPPSSTAAAIATAAPPETPATAAASPSASTTTASARTEPSSDPGRAKRQAASPPPPARTAEPVKKAARSGRDVVDPWER